MSRSRTGPQGPTAPIARAADPGASAPAAADDAAARHALAVARRDARLGRASAAAPAAPTVPAAPAAVTVRTVVPIAGMTCRSCEVRVSRHVGRIPGVARASASAVRGRVEIESAGPVSADAIRAAIGAAGYEIGRSPWIERDPVAWGTAGAGLVVVLGLAVAVGVSGLGNLAGGLGDLAGGGLAIALLLGLAAGVSTCMAMVGGLVLALSASHAAREAERPGARGGRWSAFRPAVLLVAGRVAGYGLLGAALGAVGATLTLPAQATAALMIAVALLMTLLGIRLTGLSPRVAAWSPTLPMGLARGLGIGAGGSPAYTDRRALLLGAATFFLPCGFTQAVQVFALSTGSPLYAGALLAVFALGTAPGLLAVAGLPMVAPASSRPALLRVAGVAVLAFALVNATAGLRLAGIGLPGSGGPQAVALAAAAPASARQTLTTVQYADGYSPASAAIYAGQATTWTIESRSTASCASSIVVPLLGISARLHLGANTIELPPLSAGTVSYSCSMGMFGGSITVLERPAAAGQTPDG